MKTKGTQILIVCLYVDDLIYVGNSNQLIDDFRRSMIGEFEMIDLGLISYFLSIEVKQVENKIFIYQKK